MSDAIQIRGLRKSYGDVEAVRGIDLTVRRGEVFALLGPNGAGKTTTVEIMEGYRRRDGGEVSVLGHDPARRERALRERIGIVLQSTGVDPYLTVAETIELYRRAYPSPRPVEEIVDLVGLRAKRDTRVLKLSGGQQRRLDVAVALAGDPELLFLDEPTTGFDPAARRGAWDIVRNLSALGKTVFLTTHYMDEAQVLAKEVAIISNGLIVAQGPPASLGGQGAPVSTIRFRLSADAAELPQVIRDRATVSGDSISLVTDAVTRSLYELTSWAIDHGVVLEDLEVARPSLEDVYLQITAGAEGGAAADG